MVEALDNLGNDFSYVGKVTIVDQPDEYGALRFEVPGTKETWYGAVDATDDTILFVDNYAESRVSNQVEFSFGIALRPVPD